MATTSTPMTLDGFVVETFDDKKQDEQSQNAPTSSVLEPVPTVSIIMPEPHATGIGGFRISENLPQAVVGSPAYTMPVPVFPSGPAESTQGQGTVQEEKRDERKEEKSRRSSSDSSEKGKDEKKNKHKHHHHSKETSDIPYELKHDEVVSSERILSRDAKVLADFLRLHGFIKPSFHVHLFGTHTERRTRTVRNSDGNGSHTVTDTVTVTDFSFSIDLADLFTEEPLIYTVRDDVPAYRGAMTMAVETGGARPIERRTLVERDVQSAQKDAIIAGRNVGRPPWLVTAETGAKDDEAHMGTTPQASSRTFEEWIEDYIQSKRIVKEFIFRKEIIAWDLDTLTTSLEALIRSTGYTSHIAVNFSTSPECVHVYSPNAVSKIFASYLWIFLTSVVLVFPFLWMWRRWWPGAGGRWEVAGAAFRLKRWELVPGTGPGETEAGALERLGGSLGVGGGRLRAGKEGVWVLEGVHEADWFRSWEESIRCGVRERTREAWLTKRRVMDEIAKASAIASGLDHL